ncbi:MAG: SDR family NAD(P)-dependent oxidoreductase [Pseudomonadota bacterium]
MTDRKVALVTGGNRGIGLQVVYDLAERGFHVVLACRDLDAGNAAMHDRGLSDELVTVMALDVADPDSTQHAAKTFGASFDHLDVLVNNAGILSDIAKVIEVDDDGLNAAWNTNALGPLRVTRAMLPFLRKSEDGRVINVSSLGGQLTGATYWTPPAYRISKAALNAVTRCLALELADDRIKVNAVSPGWVKTDMGGEYAHRSLEEGADTIVWLACDEPGELNSEFVEDRAPVAW